MQFPPVSQEQLGIVRFLGSQELLDFYLWAHLKSKVYQIHQETIQEVKRAICGAVIEIPVETLEATMRVMFKITQECLAFNGGHMKSVIFKT